MVTAPIVNHNPDRIFNTIIMAENKEKLFDQFPPISTAEWKAKVEADLKDLSLIHI